MDALVPQIEQLIDLNGLAEPGEWSAAAHGVEGAVLFVADAGGRHSSW